MKKKPIKILVIGPEGPEIVEAALTPENYHWFPKDHTYAVMGAKTTEEIPKDFEGIIIIGDSTDKGAAINKLAQTKWSRKTICIGPYERKDHIEIGGFWWCNQFFALTTALPELINKIVDKP